MEPTQTNIIATLLAGIDTIPTLPAIVGRVTAIIADPESSAWDLMETITPDQSLTLKILKIANSAFYGRIHETGSLEQALTVLGFEEIRNLVVSTAVFNSFSKLKSTPSFDPGKFWRHAFVCGLAARIIAKKTSLSEGELFVAGLIHDIGKLAICMVLPKEFGHIVKTASNVNFRTTGAEMQILGITHAEVGAKLVRRWMLPQNLVSAVGYHHRPAMAPHRSAYPMVIHIADLLAHKATAKETSVDDIGDPETSGLAQTSGLATHPDTLTEFMAALEVQREANAGILEIFLS